MQQTLLIIVIEVLLLALLALIVHVLLNWRVKMRRHAALEKLIDEVKDRQGLRSEKIVDCLTEQYQLDQQVARELSAVLFTAEKLFLAQFIEQQIQESVDGFYENLCELLDSYLSVIPAKAINSSHSGGNQINPEPDGADPEKMQEIGLETGKESTPEWGDVFD